MANFNSRDAALVPKATLNDAFTWESDYRQSWEGLEENERGFLQPQTGEMTYLGSSFIKKRILHAQIAMRKGLIRAIVIIIDWACFASDVGDSYFKGTWIIKNSIKPLLIKLFDDNPLVQVSLILARDGIAQILSPLSSNYHEHIRSIDNLLEKAKSDDWCPKGAISLSNCLEIAISILKHSSAHGSREIILFQNSLSSHDNVNPYSYCGTLVKERIFFSAISLIGEMFVIKKLAQDTKGVYNIAINEGHFLEVSKEFCNPRPSFKDSKLPSFLLEIGFPFRSELNGPALCACHSNLVYNGYFCPVCSSLVCQIPKDCPICNITLVCASTISKFYHKLFPLPSFVPIETSDGVAICAGCDQTCTLNLFRGFVSCKCSKCQNNYCEVCNYYIHSELYNCPSCRD